jgi:hypothetical protein
MYPSSQKIEELMYNNFMPHRLCDSYTYFVWHLSCALGLVAGQQVTSDFSSVDSIKTFIESFSYHYVYEDIQQNPGYQKEISRY